MNLDQYRPPFDRDSFVIVPQLLAAEEFAELCRTATQHRARPKEQGPRFRRASRARGRGG
jgi:hypothetical protein